VPFLIICIVVSLVHGHKYPTDEEHNEAPFKWGENTDGSTIEENWEWRKHVGLMACMKGNPPELAHICFKQWRDWKLTSHPMYYFLNDRYFAVIKNNIAGPNGSMLHTCANYTYASWLEIQHKHGNFLNYGVESGIAPKCPSQAERDEQMIRDLNEVKELTGDCKLTMKMLHDIDAKEPALGEFLREFHTRFMASPEGAMFDYNAWLAEQHRKGRHLNVRS
jgi:hypothetical protein